MDKKIYKTLNTEILQSTRKSENTQENLVST